MIQLRRTSSRKAFTLIEMLVVITIIAVLMGLAFPVFQSVQNSAKKTQAKNDLVQIVTAVNAFYTEYGKYPTAASGNPDASFTPDNKNLFYTLRGINGGDNAQHALNPRQIEFIKPLEKARGGIGADGSFYDPWGSSYQVVVDSNYDNEINNPYGGSALRSGVIAWSFGKNGVLGGGAAADQKLFSKEPGTADKYEGSGDVISWQ